jgi:hypothetical protein
MTEPEQIVFVEFQQPGLQAGEYHVHADLSVQNIPASTFLEETVYTADKYFRVSGDRFSLTVGTVDSVYPSANENGDFSRSLPHVVLNRPSLPWSRTVSENEAAHVPWMTILLLTEEELKSEGLDVTQPTKPGARDDHGVVVPCDLLKISGTLWSKIAPTLEELRFLAHGRQVIPAHKIDNPKDTLEFGLVMGNRLPPEETACYAFLVSVEGLEKELPPHCVKDSLELVVLHSWRFFAVKQVRSFGSVIHGLNHAVGLSLPREGAGPASVPLSMGYAPVPHDLRIGGQTWSWYRGPFTPYGTRRQIKKEGQGPILWADGVTFYDPELGMMDVSCSSAWALGRLMALNDTSFATTLYKSMREKVRGTIERARFRIAWGKLAAKGSVSNARRNEVDNDLSHSLLSALTKLGGAKSPEGNQKTLRARRSATRAQAMLSAAKRTEYLRNALTHDETITELHHLGEDVSLLEAGAWDEPEPSTPDAIIARWLADIALFKNIPIHYLIPSERMLPTESIRFFQVDLSWLEAFHDGALSIGRATDADVSHDIAFRPLVAATTQRATAVARPQTKRLLARRNELPMLKPLSGFLLRSDAVAQWPDMEVVGKVGDIAATTLRQQMIGSVLICLFDRVVDSVELFQPAECVHFGFFPKNDPSHAVKKKRRPDGKETDEKLEEIKFRVTGSTVLDIKELVKWMKGNEPGDFRSDQFALQMVTGVDRVVFKIKKSSAG